MGWTNHDSLRSPSLSENRGFCILPGLSLAAEIFEAESGVVGLNRDIRR